MHANLKLIVDAKSTNPAEFSGKVTFKNTIVTVTTSFCANPSKSESNLVKLTVIVTENDSYAFE